ncbi:FAD-dependent oxidoreductase [uncultured Tateyamaria sp.]|uniref:NAD(P)/FAD-dependent oxidoreductase n=1 Tax=uncultured Tateyamaria sp. TaxID=455651 RepID=UPI0026386385|nr:FAD-dependent oxidoreductase [uncultured Tateyamaria sp.]
MKTIVVGGGIIGAAIAHQLRGQGEDVIVLEAGAGATAASFGWINASFFLTPDHFRLRQAGIEAWRRLGVAVEWTGCLCWDVQGAALEAQQAELAELGYDVERVEQGAFRTLEPHVAAPDRALRFGIEGVAAPAATAERLLAGVRRVRGVRAEAVATAGGAVTGVHTGQGFMAADRVVIAAGTASPDLLAPLGVTLPMLDRPGVMVRTRPVPQVMTHVLVTPDAEVRQDAQGHIWTPTAANHQADEADRVDAPLDHAADVAVARLRALLPQHVIAWDQVMLAHRPVPQDGLPVFGPAGPRGCFVAVMHSGVTLAAIAAELVAAQVTGRPLSNRQAALAAPYTVDRFQSR